MPKVENDLQSAPRQSFCQQEAALFFRHARRVTRHPAFDILIAQRRDLLPKLLVVTPGRIGNAPQRNKIRRQIKAIFYEQQPIGQEYDCALIIKKPALLLSFTHLAELITNSLVNYAPAKKENP